MRRGVQRDGDADAGLHGRDVHLQLVHGARQVLVAHDLLTPARHWSEGRRVAAGWLAHGASGAVDLTHALLARLLAQPQRQLGSLPRIGE